jgi:hypothetical protein
MAEKDIQKEIESYLNSLELLYIPRANEAKGGRKRFIRKDLTGIPDLIMPILKRITIFMEIKKPGETLRKDQEKWKEYLIKANQIYYTVESFKEAKKIIDYWRQNED